MPLARPARAFLLRFIEISRRPIDAFLPAILLYALEAAVDAVAFFGRFSPAYASRLIADAEKFRFLPARPGFYAIFPASPASRLYEIANTALPQNIFVLAELPRRQARRLKLAIFRRGETSIAVLVCAEADIFSVARSFGRSGFTWFAAHIAPLPVAFLEGSLAPIERRARPQLKRNAYVGFGHTREHSQGMRSAVARLIFPRPYTRI